MRTIKYTNQFKRDFRREKAGKSRLYGQKLDALLMDAVRQLAADAVLPLRLRDHPLSGAWSDCRDCHLRPDLVLIYRKPDVETLELIRLGSHGELGF